MGVNGIGDIYLISEKLPKLKILVEAKEESGIDRDIIVKNGIRCYDYHCSYYESDEENEDDKESEENEDGEEEENNDNYQEGK